MRSEDVSRLLLAAAISLAIVPISGCSDGPALGNVTGKVTMDGQALGNVLVTFEPKQGGGASTGKTDSTGQYELLYMDRKGAVVGEHRVSVTALIDAPPVKEISSDDPEYARQATGGSAAYKQAPAVSIPARYNTNSELTKEVKSGSNEINLELKSS
jgi:hypothetical protein